MLVIFFGILAISFLLAPLGCVLLWQRYNYFSDGLAHASIFSGILSYFLDLSQSVSMLIISLSFSAIIYLFKFLSNRNNVVSIVSTAFVACAIMIASKLEDKSILNVMLFGDMLSIAQNEVITIGILSVIIIILLAIFQRDLSLIALDRDLAKVQNVKVELIEFISLLCFGLIIALTVKIVGALLITALLITPAAAARLISNNPTQMVLSALFIAIISGILGLFISFGYDLPLSSAIVTLCIIIYGVMNLALLFAKRG